MKRHRTRTRRYVHPESQGGDGTTPATTGPHAAYRTLREAIAAEGPGALDLLCVSPHPKGERIYLGDRAQSVRFTP